MRSFWATRCKWTMWFKESIGCTISWHIAVLLTIMLKKPVASVLPAFVQAGWLAAHTTCVFSLGPEWTPCQSSAVWSRYEVPEIDFLVYSWKSFSVRRRRGRILSLGDGDCVYGISSSSCSWRVSSVILFLNPQHEVGPSTSSLAVPCSFVLSVYIVMLVFLVYLCPSSVRVVATFSGIVLFPLLYPVLLFFP